MQLQTQFKDLETGFKTWLAKQSLPVETAVVSSSIPTPPPQAGLNPQAMASLKQAQKRLEQFLRRKSKQGTAVTSSSLAEGTGREKRGKKVKKTLILLSLAGSCSHPRIYTLPSISISLPINPFLALSDLFPLFPSLRPRSLLPSCCRPLPLAACPAHRMRECKGSWFLLQKGMPQVSCCVPYLEQGTESG